MKITFLGHACFLIETPIDSFMDDEHKGQSLVKTEKLLLDPYIRSNPLAKSIDVSKIKADYILVTHGHLDHVEDIEEIYKNQKKCVLVSNYEIVAWYRKQGFVKTHPIMPGGNWKFNFGVLHAVEESHSSSLPDGTYAGCPLGFIITANNKTCYFAGDTGLHYNMKLIKELHKIDYAILPIGGNFTMDVNSALIASDFVGTDKIIPMHYDTNDMIRVNKNTALQSAKKYKKELIFMDIGQSMDL